MRCTLWKTTARLCVPARRSLTGRPHPRCSSTPRRAAYPIGLRVSAQAARRTAALTQARPVRRSASRPTSPAHLAAMIVCRRRADIRKVSLLAGPRQTLTTTEVYTRGDPTKSSTPCASCRHICGRTFPPSDNSRAAQATSDGERDWRRLAQTAVPARRQLPLPDLCPKQVMGVAHVPAAQACPKLSRGVTPMA